MKNKEIAIIGSKQDVQDAEPLFSKYLIEKKNMYTIFIVSDITNKKFYNKKYPDSFSEVICEPDEYDCLNENISTKTIIKKALEIEKKIGCSIYRLFFTDRVVGGGFFSSGGYNHPKTHLRNDFGHMDMMKIAVLKVKFWTDLLEKVNVRVAINLPNTAHIIAQSKNIYASRVQGARFGNTKFWTSDLYIQPDNMESEYKKNYNTKYKAVILNTPYKANMTFRSIHINNYKFSTTVRRSILAFAITLRGKLKGFKKSKNKYLIAEFIGIWRRRIDFNKLKRITSINFKDINGIKYIYFPLQTEPEVALHGIAQDFFFQLSAINMISRDLPANYRLVVKEHLLAVGRRPKDFYDQIKSLKNVLFANPLDIGLDYIKGAKAVACITGTAGWEASVLGVPVISFSKNNAFNFLDHVFYVKEPDSTKEIINNIINTMWPNKKSIKDGSCFYNTYLNISFDIKDAHEFISWSVSEKNNIQNYAELLINEFFKKKSLI